MDLDKALHAVPTGERLRVDFDAGCLIGSRCASCQTTSWPARAICHRCGSAGSKVQRLSVSGRLTTYTVVSVSRGDLQAPFTLGQVELPEGLLIFGHVRGLAADDVVPLEVSLRVAGDPATIPPFWFEPVRR